MFGPVLGIDPGVSRCGYGVVVQDGGRLESVAFGVIRTLPADPLPERLAEIWNELEGIMEEIRPVSVAVERVFFQTNVRTAMSVGQASGLALTVAARRGLPVHQYTPNEVKQAIAGYGAADKAQVQSMVAKLLRLPEVPSPPDAADALALAVCHLSAGRFHQAAGRASPAGAATGNPALARAIAQALTKEQHR